MSRIPAPTTTKRSVKKTSSKVVPAGSARPDSGIAKVQPVKSQLPGPTLLQKRVFKEALSKSALDPKNKVRAVGAQRTTIPPPKAKTKRGEEPVLQQITMEKTVQRTPKGEYIAKTMKGIDVDPAKRTASQVEITAHDIDPRYGTESAGVNLTVSASSSITVTTGGKQLKKNISKRTIKAKRLLDKPNLNPAHVNRLVRDENEDVENTLKMAPPELVNVSSLETYPLKRKIRNLRLNSESMALLERSLIHSAPTADEVELETSPEVMASVMHAVEKGATPDSAPDQVFNSLFPETQPEGRIPVASVAPGPLLDIVLPVDHAYKLTDEVLNEEMEEALKELQNMAELPTTDLCSENNIQAPPREDKGEKKVPTVIEDEIPPWEDGNVQKIYALVGSEPLDLLEATDPSVFVEDDSKDLVEELAKGVDYFLEADANNYETKVQIRGSRLPKWFPGYMVALPHYPEVVRIAKTPSGVLHSAWKAVQPRLFPEESVLMV